MMKQKYLKTILLLCALIVGSGTMWADDITIAMKGYASGSSANYITSDTEAEIGGVKFKACNYTPSNGQLRGNQTAIGSNFYIYNTTASPGPITKIELKNTGGTGSGFQNNMYAATGSSSQSSVNSVSGLTAGTRDGNASFTWTFSADAGITYFKLCTDKKFTNGQVFGEIIITYSAGPTTFTVTYDGNGNTGGSVPTDATAYSSGATVTVLGNTGSLVKTGYNFGGWNKQADGNGTNYAAEATFTISANTTLYAQWIPIPHTVTLGDNNVDLTEENGGEGVTLPSRSNIGDYTFAGWSETDVAEETTTAPTIIPAGSYTPASDITLYPVYTRVVGGGGPVNYTVSVNIGTYASANGWANDTQYDKITIDENIRVEAFYGNSGKYYSSNNSWRIYSSAGGVFNIVASNGAELTSATITLASGTLSHNETNITSGSPVALSGESAGFKAVTNAQVTAISVDYTISGGGTTYYLSSPVVSLSEAANNNEMLTDLNGETHTVTLTRTLKKTDWNTFCVPFSTAIPDGWTVKELNTTAFSAGTLTLDFKMAESIVAGKPYLVKVGESDVVNPTFSGVTIVNSTTTTTTTYADFVPVLTPTQLTGPDKTKLYLSGENTLYYPSTNMNINGFRAYFQLNNGLTAGDVASGSARAFVLNFDGETTGISLTPDPSRMGEGSIYTLDGRKVQSATRKGIYIKRSAEGRLQGKNGRKIVIK